MNTMGGDPIADWRSIWQRQARAHPGTTAGLAGALAVLVVLLLATLWQVAAGRADAHLWPALAGGSAAFAATAAGGLLGLLLRGLTERAHDVLLGSAAGMMLAASAYSLLLPGLDAGEQLAGGAIAGALLVTAGIGLGVVLMLGLHQFTPHEHEFAGEFGAGTRRVSRIWLFVLAITLHNLPEGMAIGIGFSRGDFSVGVPLTAAIMLQNVPEGLAVAMVLRTIGVAPLRAALIAAGTGLVEPLGALMGLGLTTGMAAAYPLGLGLAGGAMIFVVSHEVIPETHRNGHQTPATIGLLAGFALIMVLDVALG
ncbi:MAG TPA: ZIP family metal transporter [Burkholderiaceae bacterium]|nr:ZIP family metal transporter [Burkholderiaceae bacterium]